MAGMYVSWGNFNFKPHEAGISLKVDIAYSERGFPKHTDVTFQIDGELCEADEYATETRLAEIRDAFSFNYQDIVYRHSDGSPSVHSLANADPSNMTGNHVMSASYPETKDGEFVSGRTFHIGVGARLKLNGFSDVLEYTDNLRFIGNGGPVWEMFHDRWTGYYFEMVSPNSPQIVMHYGKKVTANNWHFPPSPMFQQPYEKNTERQITLGGPKVYPNGMTEFTTEWSYKYQIPGGNSQLVDTLRPRTGYL